jgi:putative transposase
MLDVSTRRASKLSLRRTACGINRSANRTSLRAIRRWYLDQSTTTPSKLVSKAIHNHTPSGIKNTSIKTAFSGYVLSGLINGTSRRSHHVLDIQILDDDRTVTLGVSRREIMDHVTSLSTHGSIKLSHSNTRFFLIVASFPPSSDDALSMSKPAKRSLKISRIFINVPIAIGHKIHYTTIECDNRLRPCDRIGQIDLTNNRDKPLIYLTNERTSLRRSLERTMNNNVHCSKLGKNQRIIFKTPDLGVWLTDVDLIAPLLFPTRLKRDLLKTPLPCLIELDEKLSTNVTRNVRKPRNLDTKLRKLIDLIKRRIVPSLKWYASKTSQSLLLCKVPKKSQGTFPVKKSSKLLLTGIDAKAKGLANDHDRRLYWSHLMSTIKQVDFRRGRHVLSVLNAHLVFVAKYRQGVITKEAFVILRDAWLIVCKKLGAELRESNFEPDHVHLLVTYPPRLALSVLVNSLKGVSARKLRETNLLEIREKLWGDHFWSPSYCAISCGGAPLEIIARYVQRQRGAGSSSSSKDEVSACGRL